MKFRCDRDELSEALQTVQRGVSSRPGIPALTGVLLEAAERGHADAHDHRPRGLGPARDRACRSGGRGSALVPARLLARHGEVALGRAGGRSRPMTSQARIRCAAYEGTLRLLPAEDFPGLQEPGGTRDHGRARPRSPRPWRRSRARPSGTRRGRC